MAVELAPDPKASSRVFKYPRSYKKMAAYPKTNRHPKKAGWAAGAIRPEESSI
jgi:hypothetical protein